MLITIQSNYPSLPHCHHLPSLSLVLGFFSASRSLRRIKHMKGEATLLVRSQAEIERRCYFLSVIFFTGRLCNVDGNWTESKRMKTLIRACVASMPDSRFRGKFHHQSLRESNFSISQMLDKTFPHTIPLWFVHIQYKHSVVRTGMHTGGLITCC